MDEGKKLFLLISHRLSSDQQEDARKILGVTTLFSLPENLKKLWSQIPPEADGINDFLMPIKEWLKRNALSRDYVLIQGDFGATYLMVKFAFEMEFIPVYATTARNASEKDLEDGSIKMEHVFKFSRFRKYGL